MAIRNSWRKDRDGVWSIFKDPDSEKTYTINVNRFAGLTIANTPDWSVNSGDLTILSESNTSNQMTVKVSGTGEATVTFTDGDGDKQVITLRWKERDR